MLCFLPLLIMVPFSVLSQPFKKTHSFEKDTFSNGKTIHSIEIWVKESKEFNLHSYSKSTKKVIKHYYSDGKLHYELTYNTSIGTDEAKCEELRFIQKEYWPNGKRKTLIKSECDCHILVNKEWNANGKLLTKSKSKIKR